MRPQVIGPGRGPLPGGLVERLLVIGLGLAALLLIQFTPFAGLRSSLSAATAPRAAATAVSTPVPSTAAPATAVPPATVAPTAAEEPQPAADPARPAPPDAPGFRVVAGGDGANLRSAPSRSAPVVVSVRDGTVLADLDEARTADGLQWQHVASGNLEGWIAAELVTPAQ